MDRSMAAEATSIRRRPRTHRTQLMTAPHKTSSQPSGTRGTSIAHVVPILSPEKPMLPYRFFVRVALCVLSLGLSVPVAAAQQRTDFGTLSIQVRPPNAEIFIDGERWNGSGESGPLQVQLS